MTGYNYKNKGLTPAVTQKLIYSGALDEFGHNRKSLEYATVGAFQHAKLYEGKDCVHYEESDVEHTNPIADPIVYPIDEAMSASMEKGTYYCSLTIIGSDLIHTVIGENDCTLTVK